MKLNVRLTALVLCAAMGVSLYGCRYSSVLEQIIYEMTKSNDIEDQYFYPEENVMDSDNNTEDLVPIDADETDRTHDEIMNLPTDEEENSDRGTQLSYNENAYSDQSTSQSSSDSTQSGTNGTGNSSRGDTTTSDSIANNSETGEGSDTVLESYQEGSGRAGNGYSGISSVHVGDEGDTESSEGEGGTTESGDINDYGEEPEPVKAGTVAAAGSVALMVMMLTGTDEKPTGALVATNENLINNTSACEVFPGLEKLVCAWSGDGTQYADINALEESQAEIVAYVASNDFATNVDDIKEMYARVTGSDDGHLLQLRDMTSYQEDVEYNMTWLAENLLSEDYPDTTNRAVDYINWENKVYDFLNEETADWANTQTLYVDGWDAEVQYSMELNFHNDSYTGTGCAYISSQGTPLGRSLITYMGIGGVTDTIKFSNSSSPSTYYFVPVSPRTQEGVWTPNEMTSLGIKGFYNNREVYQMFTENGATSSHSRWGTGEGLGLGNSGFKTLVAGNVNTQTGIKGEYQPTENGQGGSWGVYGPATGTSGDQGGSYMDPVSHGFNNQSGYLMESFIYGDYNVVVNPCGLISDWVTAGPESLLESAWVAYKLRGVGSYDEMADLVRSFYRDLCRYPQISDDQIYGILMENYNTLTYYRYFDTRTICSYVATQ